MNQIPLEGKYCGNCPMRSRKFGKCRFFNNTVLKMAYLKVDDWHVPDVLLRLPECLEQKPQIIPTAKFNHEACAKLWEQIGNDFMGEGMVNP